MKPKSYMKKVWVKFSKILSLQNINIDQLVIGTDLSKEDEIILHKSTQNLQLNVENYEILSKSMEF